MIITSGYQSRLFLMVVMALLIVPVGCREQQSVVRAPIARAALLTLPQQLTVINARAAALATLRATGSITLDYRGRLRNKHEYKVNGTLLVDQTEALLDTRHKTSPDMLLVGTYLGQDAFELGMNTTHYWMVDHENKQAWVGRQSLRRNAASRVMPFRPGNVLQMLAITSLQQNATQRVAMTTSRKTAINRIYIIRLGRQGHTWIERILFFNRRSDEITAVIMFNRAGRSMAAASLRDYRPITVRGKKTAILSPRIPFHIEIWCPAGHAHLILNLDHASLTLRVASRFAFALPRLSGLKVVRVNDLAKKNGSRLSTP